MHGVIVVELSRNSEKRGSLKVAEITGKEERIPALLHRCWIVEALFL